MFSTFNTFSSTQNIVKNVLKLADVLLPNELIQNESFESPVVDQGIFYVNLTESQKEEFKWVAGGNNFQTGVNRGPAISPSNVGFVFPPFVTGRQALAMQSTGFIQQDIYLDIGTYIFSAYFISRRGTDYNPIQVSINGTIITTIDQVVDEWTLFTHTFNILEGEAGDKTLRLEGTASGDDTTGIDLVALSRTKFEILLEAISKTPYAYFRAKDYDPDTREIPAQIGDFTATTEGEALTVGDGAGNGADASIPFLNGTVNSIINFKVDVPVNFTVCSITRYSSSDPVKQDGILYGSGNSAQFIHGHWNSWRGVAYYKAWMTSISNSGLRTEWLVMCGKNNSNQPNNILADNNKVGTSDGGTVGQTNLGINNQPRPSDFEFSQLLIWDSVLTDDEMQEVSNYLTQYLVDGLD